MYLEEKKIGEPEIKTLEPWRQVLLDAADYIEKYGHCKKHFTENEKVCAIGAIHYKGRNGEAAKEMAAGKLRKFLKLPRESLLGVDFAASIYLDNAAIVKWNDAPKRTAKQVVTAMRDCARQN